MISYIGILVIDETGDMLALNSDTMSPESDIVSRQKVRSIMNGTFLNSRMADEFRIRRI